MLILGRKVGERIHIGPVVTITITEIRKGRVVVGVDAPPELDIWRSEPQIINFGTEPTPAKEVE